MHVSYRWFKTMVEYGFTLRTKYFLYLYTKNKNYPTKWPKPKSYLIPNLKRKKKIPTRVLAS